VSKLDVAEQIWKQEVEVEAVKLILNGVPPYEAKMRAVGIVSHRRRMDNAEESRC